jgi:hypothetical protein
MKSVLLCKEKGIFFSRSVLLEHGTNLQQASHSESENLFSWQKIVNIRKDHHLKMLFKDIISSPSFLKYLKMYNL